jgi:hypothetical protein
MMPSYFQLAKYFRLPFRSYSIFPFVPVTEKSIFALLHPPVDDEYYLNAALINRPALS